MEMISLSDIKVASKYLRTNTNVDTLIKSIEQVGVIHPLIVNKNKELISGGRRYSALKQMGKAQAPCVIVDENELKQELISIDENLVRKNLSEVEFENCLLRGKEIYEKLNPEAAEEITLEDIKPVPPKKKATEDITQPVDNDEKLKTFVQETSEKTGLSERQIKVAILRDQESAPSVKKARLSGEISAGHANELIKLKHEDQEKLLPHIKEKPTGYVKKIVKDIESVGVEAAIKKSITEHPLAKELDIFKNNSKKLNKLARKFMNTDEELEGLEFASALKEVKKLQDNISKLVEFLEFSHGVESSAADDSELDSDFVPAKSSETHAENFAR